MSNSLQLTDQGKLKHLIETKTLSLGIINEIFKTADSLKKQAPSEYKNLLTGKNICNVFFEASTRTLCSFELAAKKLGANVINFNTETSSTRKGETFIDTIETLNAMSFDAFVIRHPTDGSVAEIAKKIGDNCSIINAGNGCSEHPTQALLDAYTILHHHKKLDGLKISIVGDIEHSRVARSLLHILSHMGATKIHLVGPESLVPKSFANNIITVEHNFSNGIADSDVIVMLRIQKERMETTSIPNSKEYFDTYGLTKDRLALAKPDAIVMHPGPINRGVEISTEVAECNQSIILEQVKNGVYIRMAVMLMLLT